MSRVLGAYRRPMSRVLGAYRRHMPRVLFWCVQLKTPVAALVKAFLIKHIMPLQTSAMYSPNTFCEIHSTRWTALALGRVGLQVYSGLPRS